MLHCLNIACQLSRSITRLEQIVLGAIPLLRVGEVIGQNWVELFQPAREHLLDHFTNPAMQLSAPFREQAFIGRLLYQSML